MEGTARDFFLAPFHDHDVFSLVAQSVGDVIDITALVFDVELLTRMFRAHDTDH